MKTENSDVFSELMSKLGDANEELHKLGLDIKRQELELQKEHEQNKKRLIIAVVCFLIVTTIGVVVIIRIRSKREVEMFAVEAQLEAERQEEQFQNQMQSYYDKGYKLLQTGDYLGAIQVFQQVDSKASCYSDVLDEMTYCRDKYIQSVIQNVSTAIEEERYVDALNELTEGLSYCEDSQELKDKKNEVLSVFKEKNKEIANASAEGGDYMSAIEYLNEIIKFDSNDSEVNELFREYNKQIILTNVYELKKSGKYMDALNVIKNSAYAEDEELQDLYLEINSLYNENEIQYETNFYGIWCYASKDYSDAQINADTLIKYGFDAQVILTTDWDNLNAEKWYVVTAGMYSTEEDAKEDLPSVQTVCKTAYVKYSGNPK